MNNKKITNDIENKFNLFQYIKTNVLNVEPYETYNYLTGSYITLDCSEKLLDLFLNCETIFTIDNTNKSIDISFSIKDKFNEFDIKILELNLYFNDSNLNKLEYIKNFLKNNQIYNNYTFEYKKQLIRFE